MTNPPASAPMTDPPRARPWVAYFGALAAVGGCTVIAELMQRRFDLSNLTMVYLVGVVVSAIAFGRGPAIFSSMLSVAAFNFFFVPPRFTFDVADPRFLVTFAVLLLVAVVIATLTARLREQLDRTRQRELRTAALYRLSHDLAASSTAAEVAGAAVLRISEIMGARVAVLAPDADGRLRVAAAAGAPASDPPAWVDPAAARWAHENGELAGSGTAVLPDATGVFAGLRGPTRVLGVLAVEARDPLRFRDAERAHLLRALASQTALALERCRLAGEAETARTQAEAERTRSALLSAVSHDLRTPLAAITGAASGLRDAPGTMSEAIRRDLADTIVTEAQRLNRLIGNLLEMTRLESGAVRARKEWHSLEEIVGAALGRLEATLGNRPIHLDLLPDLPLVPLDDVLFEQVVFNLVENADKYAPVGSPIDISAVIEGGELRFEVADRGPGFAPGEERRVFEKFNRGAAGAGRSGVGLGLAVCRGMIAAHAGTITAANRPDGGAILTVRLPLGGAPPVIEAESAS
jgi:two-component system, OmpR family, sensor histidine kinase KdpD